MAQLMSFLCFSVKFSLFAWIWYISKISMVVLSALPKIYRSQALAKPCGVKASIQLSIFPLTLSGMLVALTFKYASNCGSINSFFQIVWGEYLQHSTADVVFDAGDKEHGTPPSMALLYSCYPFLSFQQESSLHYNLPFSGNRKVSSV